MCNNNDNDVMLASRINEGLHGMNTQSMVVARIIRTEKYLYFNIARISKLVKSAEF